MKRALGILAMVIGSLLVGTIVAQVTIIEPDEANLGPFTLLSNATSGSGSILHCWNNRVQPRYITIVVTWGAWPTATATPTGAATATPTPTTTPTRTATPVASGAIQLEVSDDPNFTGTWAPFGTPLTVSGVYKKDLVQSGAPVQYLRARLSTAMGNGQRASVTALLVR